MFTVVGYLLSFFFGGISGRDSLRKKKLTQVVDVIMS